jgi:hypothetical protein
LRWRAMSSIAGVRSMPTARQPRVMAYAATWAGPHPRSSTLEVVAESAGVAVCEVLVRVPDRSGVEARSR